MPPTDTEAAAVRRNERRERVGSTLLFITRDGDLHVHGRGAHASSARSRAHAVFNPALDRFLIGIVRAGAAKNLSTLRLGGLELLSTCFVS